MKRESSRLIIIHNRGCAVLGPCVLKILQQGTSALSHLLGGAIKAHRPYSMNNKVSNQQQQQTNLPHAGLGLVTRTWLQIEFIHSSVIIHYTNARGVKNAAIEKRSKRCMHITGHMMDGWGNANYFQGLPTFLTSLSRAHERG